MNFEQKLDKYADIIIQNGMNVQKGQDVYISSEAIHRDFVGILVKKAYEAGARIVVVDLNDPRNVYHRIRESKEDKYLEYVPGFIPVKAEGMLPETAASLRLIGPEFPDLLADLDPKKINTLEFNYKKSLKKFYEQGVGLSKVQWSIAAASTPKWAKRVFPELDEKKAHEALWEQIFHICRADKPDGVELWKKHNEELQARAKRLSNLKIETLHFKGPGTDLRVGLSPIAKFRGGGDKSPRGVKFEPNIPTEECFTTPDRRKTEGTVQTTRPFLINGKLIKGLHLTFKEGKIVTFKATDGEETFKEYIHSDPGAKYLGEVSLVGIDSPIFQSGRVFEEILFDENAACHIAIGFAYQFCLDGSEGMKAEELESVGYNVSHVHTDMMISNEKVDVYGECAQGKKIPLIKQGAWLEF